jgi:pimeloyl-ACP methyl ester carboxylesterase
MRSRTRCAALSLATSWHLAERIPGARYQVLEDTGHLPHLEAHAQALDAIAGFVAEVA